MATSYVYSIDGRGRGGKFTIIYGTSLVADDPTMMLKKCKVKRYSEIYKRHIPPISPFCSRIYVEGNRRLQDGMDIVELAKHPGEGSFAELLLRPVLTAMRAMPDDEDLGFPTTDIASNIAGSRIHNELLFNVTDKGKITLLIRGVLGESLNIQSLLGVSLQGHVSTSDIPASDRLRGLNIELSPSYKGRDGEKMLRGLKRTLISQTRMYQVLYESAIVPTHVMQLYMKGGPPHRLVPERMYLQNDPLAAGIMLSLDDGPYNFPLVTAGKCTTLRHMLEDVDYSGEKIPIEGYSRLVVDKFVNYDAGYEWSRFIPADKLSGLLNFADFIGYIYICKLVNDVVEVALKLPEDVFSRFIGEEVAKSKADKDKVDGDKADRLLIKQFGSTFKYHGEIDMHESLADGGGSATRDPFDDSE
jgi:hypothetical protein